MTSIVHRLRAFVAVLVAGVLWAPATAMAQQASPQSDAVQPGLGIRLLDAPVARKDDPRAQVYIVDHVAPGAVFSRRIEVSNGTGRDIAVRLYSRPAQIEGGSFTALDQPVEDPVAQWVQVEPATMNLANGARGIATVTVRVPNDASAGEHYAAILAELPAAAPAPGTVAVSSRVGIRVYLSVGGGAEPAAGFTIDSLRASRSPDGRPLVEARITNSGGRALDLTGELVLRDGPSRLSAGPFGTHGVTTLGVDGSGWMQVDLDRDLPTGPWRAVMTAKSGQLERKAEATIVFPDAPGQTQQPVPAKAIHGRNGLLLLAVAALLVLLWVLLAFLFLRRRRDEEEEQEDAVRAPEREPVGAGRR